MEPLNDAAQRQSLQMMEAYGGMHIHTGVLGSAHFSKTAESAPALRGPVYYLRYNVTK